MTFPKILVVENELVIAHTIKEMLSNFGYGNVIIAHNLEKAELLLETEEPQLAILDINLEYGKEGFQLAKKCQDKKISFLYATSYSNKLMLDEAMETLPIAYVTKPVLSANLYAAVKIGLNKLEKVDEDSLKIAEGRRLFQIPLSEILYIQAENNYIKIIGNERNYLIRKSLNKALELLPTDQFIQIHRSYIINSQYVQSYQINRVFIRNLELPVSRGFKKRIKELISTP